jgi:hypothetical protein
MRSHQLFSGAFKDDLAQAYSQDIVGFIEDGLCRSRSNDNVGGHAHFLSTLARE